MDVNLQLFGIELINKPFLCALKVSLYSAHIRPDGIWLHIYYFSVLIMLNLCALKKDYLDGGDCRFCLKELWLRVRVPLLLYDYKGSRFVASGQSYKSSMIMIHNYS